MPRWVVHLLAKGPVGLILPMLVVHTWWLMVQRPVGRFAAVTSSALEARGSTRLERRTTQASPRSRAVAAYSARYLSGRRDCRAMVHSRRHGYRR